MARKHNYPKTRKPRDVSYSKSWQLIEEYGLSQLRSIWEEKGMYKTAWELRTSPYIIRYIAHKHGWKRPAERAPVILAGVKAGSMPADYYKGLDFSGIETINTNIKKGEF